MNDFKEKTLDSFAIEFKEAAQELGFPHAQALRSRLESFLSQALDNLLVEVEGLVPKEFVPPVVFKNDYTTAAYNMCRKEMLEALATFKSK